MNERYDSFLSVVDKLSDCPLTIPIMDSYCIPRIALISLAQALLAPFHPTSTIYTGKENILIRFNHGNWVKQKQRWSELSVQFSSVTQSCLTLRDPMNLSTPGLPVHHQLPKFTQIHAHWVGDATQPSHPLLSPSPPQSLPASGSFPMSQLIAWGGRSTGVSASASVLPVNTHLLLLKSLPHPHLSLPFSLKITLLEFLISGTEEHISWQLSVP